MHDHVVANEPHIGAALDGAVGDAAAGDLADLRDIEDFEDLGVAEHSLAPLGREQARHRLFHVVHEIVDDVVIADFDAGLFGGGTRFLVSAHIEADDRGTGGFGERDVGFGDAADTGEDDPRADFRRAELFQRAVDRFDRALHVALDDERELLAARGFQLRHHLLERAAHAGLAGGHLVALLAHAIIRHFARAAFRIDDGEAIARVRRAVEAEHLDRNRGACGIDRCAGVIHQRAHAAPFGTGHNEIADLERAALHQHGRNRAAAAVELGFDHGAFGRTARIGLEIENFSLQPDGFEQLVEIHLLGRRNLDIEDFAAERFHLDLVLQQFGPHALGLGVRLVDLVDRDDHRRFRGLGVIDGLDRLRHHAVIGRDHEHDDVGHLRAAGTHGGERGMARRVDECDLAVRGRGHLIGADMLGDAAGFSGRHFGLADGIEQRGLAVVDMAHDGDDRRARLQGRRIFGAVAAEQTFLDVGFGDALDGVAELLRDQLRGIGIDHVVDGRHVALLHQQADDVHAALRHAVREFLNGDGFRNRHFAHKLFLRLIAGMAFEPLGAATERGDGTLALVVA